MPTLSSLSAHGLKDIPDILVYRLSQAYDQVLLSDAERINSQIPLEWSQEWVQIKVVLCYFVCLLGRFLWGKERQMQNPNILEWSRDNAAKKVFLHLLLFVLSPRPWFLEQKRPRWHPGDVGNGVFQPSSEHVLVSLFHCWENGASPENTLVCKQKGFLGCALLL